jgi:hypothetical protein
MIWPPRRAGPVAFRLALLGKSPRAAGDAIRADRDLTIFHRLSDSLPGVGKALLDALDQNEFPARLNANGN